MVRSQKSKKKVDESSGMDIVIPECRLPFGFVQHPVFSNVFNMTIQLHGWDEEGTPMNQFYKSVVGRFDVKPPISKRFPPMLSLEFNPETVRFTNGSFDKPYNKRTVKGVIRGGLLAEVTVL